MNYETILALLTAKYTGVRKDGLQALARVMAIQCVSEDEAKTAIEKLTDAQVNDFVKGYRADVDKEVSTSIKTNEDSLRKKFDFVEKKIEPGNPPVPPTNPQPGDMAELIKQAVAAAIAPINERIAGFDAKNIADTRLSQLNAKLAECKDETFKAQTLKDFARMSFADDAAFAEYLNEKATDIATANQNAANNAMRGTGAPMFAQKTDDGVSKAVADFVASQKPENNPFSGREL